MFGLGRERRPRLERKYGYFRCTSCGERWESAKVFCIKGTDKVYFKQECKSCKTACNPYKVDDLLCPICREYAKDCDCSRSDDDDEHHVDPNKAHRAELCLKCRSGWLCSQRT